MRRGSLEELVERQVRRWEMRERLHPPSPPLPCIALSRLPHSGAAELAQAVADKLDYGFFGVEIVDRIARERGIDRALVAAVDERQRSSIERYVLDSFRERRFTEDEYLRSVVRTVATLGEQGMAVILGRGAPFLLGPDKALRVLVVAPLEQRVTRLASRAGLSAEAARRRLAREDEQRREFVGRFGVDPDDASLYDLVVNTGSLGLDAAQTLVIDALATARARGN